MPQSLAPLIFGAEKHSPVFLVHRQQIENHEKINRSEFTVNRRRAANFYAHFQVDIKKTRQCESLGVGKKFVDWKSAFRARRDTNCRVNKFLAFKLPEDFRARRRLPRENRTAAEKITFV